MAKLRNLFEKYYVQLLFPTEKRVFKLKLKTYVFVRIRGIMEK